MSIGDALRIACSPQAGLAFSLVLNAVLVGAVAALWKRLKKRDEQNARLQEMLGRVADRLIDYAMRRDG